MKARKEERNKKGRNHFPSFPHQKLNCESMVLHVVNNRGRRGGRPAATLQRETVCVFSAAKERKKECGAVVWVEP